MLKSQKIFLPYIFLASILSHSFIQSMETNPPENSHSYTKIGIGIGIAGILLWCLLKKETQPSLTYSTSADMDSEDIQQSKVALNPPRNFIPRKIDFSSLVKDENIDAYDKNDPKNMRLIKIEPRKYDSLLDRLKDDKEKFTANLLTTSITKPVNPYALVRYVNLKDIYSDTESENDEKIQTTPSLPKIKIWRTPVEEISYYRKTIDSGVLSTIDIQVKKEAECDPSVKSAIEKTRICRQQWESSMGKPDTLERPNWEPTCRVRSREADKKLENVRQKVKQSIFIRICREILREESTKTRN